MSQGFFKPQEGLPHKPIPLAIHLIVEAALRESWRRLRQHPPAGFNIETADEDVVIHELQKVLHGEVFDSKHADGFTSEFFAAPVREAKWENFNGKKRDLMPDLFFGLIGRPKARVPWQDGLFVECKPVGRKRSAGRHYCDCGIKRFVRGDYAWAMTSALMVAYASEGYNLSPKLDEALNARARKIPTLAKSRPCRRSQATPVSERTCFSEHGRSFKYVQTRELAPPITIRHLWLKRDATLL
jgi:hypothetical protein